MNDVELFIRTLETDMEQNSNRTSEVLPHLCNTSILQKSNSDVPCSPDSSKGVVIGETKWLNKKWMFGQISNGGGMISAGNIGIKIICNEHNILFQIIQNGIGVEIKNQNWNRTKTVKETVIKEVEKKETQREIIKGDDVEL